MNLNKFCVCLNNNDIKKDIAISILFITRNYEIKYIIQNNKKIFSEF